MPWFFGHLSNEEAQIKLAPDSKEGTFLVRFSSQPGAFTISRVATNGTLPPPPHNKHNNLQYYYYA